MRVRLLTAIALGIMLSACFSAKPPAESPADIPPPVTGITPSIFPHKSDWKGPEQHGVYVKDILDMNATACLACHKATDAVSGGAPDCHSCHKLFPHDGDVTLTTHGDYVLKNGKAACATKCHGANLKGGLSGKPCTECHKTYPHDSGWATPTAHGPEAKGDLKITNECNLCHGDDWKGGKSKTSCIDCHKGTYPHPTGWSSPDQHGAFVLKNGTGKCATQCHGVKLDGGLSGISCKEGCHKVWPHPAQGWMAVHGQTARSITLSGCTGCHKNDATGGKTGISCAKCHTALPAHQEADWLKGGHGKLVMQQPGVLTDPKGCPLCHGNALEGGKTPTLPGLKALQGCKDCHASYPSLHKPVAGAPAWNAYDGHAKWVMDQIKPDNAGVYANVLNQVNTLIIECKLCHGDDLNGGNTGLGCTNSKCHTNFPHNTDPTTSPWLSKHGTIANSETPKAVSCATANCHGKDLLGLPAGEKIVAKKLVKGCADCHLQMPHPPLAQWDHGKSAILTVEVTSKSGVKSKQDILDVSKCAMCHGSNWTGGTGKTSCYKCHATFPIPHRDAGGTLSTAWKPVTGHGKTVMDNYKGGSVKNTAAVPCKICHGAELTGGASGKTCYKCHKSFPHAAAPVKAGAVTYTFTDAAWNGANGFANSHGEYVVAQSKAATVPTTIAQQIQNECAKTCHGTDLKGGTSNISCTKCHASYPHAADWWKAFNAADAAPGGAHGTGVKANGTTGCLNGCHAIELPGGNSGKACTSCHASYPHPPKGVADWKAGHKDYINLTAAMTKTTPFAIATECAKCHISAGPPAKNECAQCHHQNVADWKTLGQHGVKATTDATGCKSCHGENLNDGTLTNGKMCVTCHGPGTKAILTSHQDTTKVVTYYDQCCDPGSCLDSSDWNNPMACTDCVGGFQDCGDPKQKTVTTAYFVPTLHANMAKQNLKSCQACHGDDLKGGISQKSCFVSNACHDPGNRYQDHTPDQKTLWLQQISTKQVDTITSLNVKYPGGKMGYCTTACHTVLYPALYGKKAFDDTLGCFDCHKLK